MGLRASIFAGAVSVPLSLCTALIQSIRSTNEGSVLLNATFLFLFIGLLSCYAIFMHGFVIVGKRYFNKALVGGSYALIGVIVVFVVSTLLLIFGINIVALTNPLIALLQDARSALEMQIGLSLLRAGRESGSVAVWTGAAALLLGTAGLIVGLGVMIYLFWTPFLLFGARLFYTVRRQDGVALGGRGTP